MMRLWSIHPRYLDTKGLVACWREGLLAKAVLEGKSSGYKNHPQLKRFDKHSINVYLVHILEEGMSRGYKFDKTKIDVPERHEKIKISDGQLAYELAHLKKRLTKRDKKRLSLLAAVKKADPHPIFRVVHGPVAAWEKI